ncbi:Holliday junction branch migration protein RuvA [Candidatus Babeliales bacterium]|nr:Holliday junction branch migration protein RuvA [Candidatus Babeliales bacterium]
MIDYLIGKVKEIKNKSIVLLVNNIGFELQISQTINIKQNEEIELHTYLHWNQEKGPSLFGFQNELEKIVFLIIIECPKIGPGIAMNILSQINASNFLEIINSQNEKALSKINGIGPKKAEQLIVQLKHKVSKLLTSGKLPTQNQQDFTMWQNVSDVLKTLNYSNQEISKAMQHIAQKYSEQNIPLDQLIRSALSFLSGKII